MRSSEIITWHEWRDLAEIAAGHDKIFVWNPCDGVHTLFLGARRFPLEMLAEEDTYTHFALVRGPSQPAAGRAN